MDVVTVLQEIASGLREGNEKVKRAVAIRTARVALAEYKRPKIKEYTLGKPEFDAIRIGLLRLDSSSSSSVLSAGRTTPPRN